MAEYSNFHYNKNLKGFARALRKEGSPGEKKLWQEVLRNEKMMGYRFRRQRAIDNYIADFFCKELMLLIEIDGLNHDWKIEEDVARDKKLNELGYITLRILHYHIMTDLPNVIRVIEDTVLGIEQVKGLKRDLNNS